METIKWFYQTYFDIANECKGIEFVVFIFFSICVVAFWVTYVMAIYTLLKDYFSTNKIKSNVS
jgi:hypothetical protein